LHRAGWVSAAGAEGWIRQSNCTLRTASTPMSVKMPNVTCIHPENSGRPAADYANFAQPEAATAGISSTLLLEKLLKIERAVGHADNLELRAMLMEAQGDAVRFQGELVNVLADMARLRERYESRSRSALSPVNQRADAPRDEVRRGRPLRERTA